MPNHITNCLTITGPEKELDAFIKKVIKSDEARGGEYFDFEEIIPQPDNIFRGNLGREEEEMCRREGRPTWYDWNRKNWGTKWNAYSFSVAERYEGGIALRFETAWAHPVPIIKAIEKMGFSVGGHWKDEGDDVIHLVNGDYGNWYAKVEFYHER